MTYSELLEMATSCGANLADVALGRMMDIVEEECGEFPSWDDTAPEWIVKEMIG